MIRLAKGGLSMKKISLLLICICLLFSCTPQNLQSFDLFIEDTTNFFLEGTTSLNLNYIYNDCKYDSQYYGLGFTSEQDYLDTMQAYKNLLKKLHQYPFKSLNQTQQIVYTALEDYLKRQIVLEDYYYYDNEYFGSYSSVVQELPLLLQMYTFNDIQDVENYFLNIQAIKDDFIQAIEFEKARQQQNIGYSQKILDDTKTQIQEIIDENGQELIENVNNTILQLNFLTSQQKQEYCNKNKEVIQNDFIGAYQTLLNGLNTIRGKSENVSIQDKEYYQAIIYNQLGIDTKISNIEEDLYDCYDECYMSLYSLLQMNSELLNKDNIYDISYNEFDDITTGLDYLKTKIFNIVPDIDDLSYEIYQVPESLQDGFAPAAYLTPKIDMYEHQKECIMINPTSTSDNIFPTLVHEGYPGHMYQNTYLRLKDYPDLMYLLDCIGYSEGWAIYMESRASEFLENNVAWQKVLITNDQLSSYLLALIDIGIHYKGWNYNECIDFYNQATNNQFTDELQSLYDIIIQTPGYYLYYIYSGEIMHQHYNMASKKLGNKFDEVEFHQTILDSGCVGLDIVEKNIKNYIKEKK